MKDAVVDAYHAARPAADEHSLHLECADRQPNDHFVKIGELRKFNSIELDRMHRGAVLQAYVAARINLGLIERLQLDIPGRAGRGLHATALQHWKVETDLVALRRGKKQ